MPSTMKFVLSFPEVLSESFPCTREIPWIWPGVHRPSSWAPPSFSGARLLLAPSSGRLCHFVWLEWRSLCCALPISWRESRFFSSIRGFRAWGRHSRPFPFRLRLLASGTPARASRPRTPRPFSTCLWPSGPSSWRLLPRSAWARSRRGSRPGWATSGAPESSARTSWSSAWERTPFCWEGRPWAARAWVARPWGRLPSPSAARYSPWWLCSRSFWWFSRFSFRLNDYTTSSSTFRTNQGRYVLVDALQTGLAELLYEGEHSRQHPCIWRVRALLYTVLAAACGHLRRLVERFDEFALGFLLGRDDVVIQLVESGEVVHHNHPIVFDLSGLSVTWLHGLSCNQSTLRSGSFVRCLTSVMSWIRFFLKYNSWVSSHSPAGEDSSRIPSALIFCSHSAKWPRDWAFVAIGSGPWLTPTYFEFIAPKI